MSLTATPARRHFVLGPGEQLLISRDALVSVERLVSFCEQTGLSPEVVVSDPLVALPLPIYARDTRFSGVKPEALWHPLFWLPADVALRLRIRESDSSEPRPESETEWALRIAIELSHSGLHDAEEGWLDVFALYGLDVENPIDLARIEAWQAGEADETLDSIDLRQHVEFTTDLAAFNDAQEIYPLLMSAQWSYTGATLIAAIEADPNDVAVYAELAAEMLSAEPDTGASDVLFEAVTALRAGEPVATWGPKIMAALNGVVDHYVDAAYELEQQ